MPDVAEAAANHLAPTDLADRCVTIGGNFFDSLPAGFDVQPDEVDSPRLD